MANKKQIKENGIVTFRLKLNLQTRNTNVKRIRIE